MRPEPYKTVERLQGNIDYLEEFKTICLPDSESILINEVVNDLTAWLAEEKAKFPSPEDYGGETDQYACALANFLGFGGHSDIHRVQREDVIRVARTLAAYGRDTGMLMCQEYGDDEDWSGIYFEDVMQWIQDWSDETRAPSPRTIDLDWCTNNAEEIIPEEYQTFEIM